MSLLSELSAIAKKLKIPAQTSVYSGNAPDEYLVFTPLYDSFELHADNAPTADVQEVRISLFTKSSYTRTVSRIVKALLARKYVGHEDDTGYHHYAVDTAKNYEMEEI